MCVKFCEMKSFDKYNLHYVELFISSSDKTNAVAVNASLSRLRDRFGGQLCMGVVSQIIDLDSTAFSSCQRLIPKGQNLVPTSRHRFGRQPCMGVVSKS